MSFTITISDNVTRFGKNAFEGCIDLADENGFIIVNGILLEYCKYEKHVTIPEGVTHINNSAFYGCSRLRSLSIPKGVVSIGNDAFRRCRKLNTLIIPEDIISIDEGAFGGCGKIKTLILPETLSESGTWWQPILLNGLYDFDMSSIILSEKYHIFKELREVATEYDIYRFYNSLIK